MIMADDPAPARDASITPEEFRDVAESAGLRLKAAMQKHMESVTKTSGFEPIPIERYRNDLEHVMRCFETKVSGSHDACTEGCVT